MTFSYISGRVVIKELVTMTEMEKERLEKRRIAVIIEERDVLKLIKESEEKTEHLRRHANNLNAEIEKAEYELLKMKVTNVKPYGFVLKTKEE